MQASRLGIDVGNAAAKVYALPSAPPGDDTPREIWGAAAPAILSKNDPLELVELVRNTSTPDARIHLVSVDPMFAAALATELTRSGRCLEHWTTDRIPMAHPYADASRLGADRLLAGFAARWLDPGRSLVVIDAGSAVTVDLVGADGAFRGGAIAPGLPLLARATGHGAQLHEIDPRSEAGYPGTSTEACLRLGVRASFDGAVRRLTRQALAAAPDAPVRVTGGDGSLAAAAVADTHPRVTSHLLALGLSLLEHDLV